MYRTIYDKEIKEWSGIRKYPLYHPNVSVGQVILEALNRNPQKIGQVNNYGIRLI